MAAGASAASNAKIARPPMRVGMVKAVGGVRINREK
jgi:hypothetical protein